jgi:hypothetical protein
VAGPRVASAERELRRHRRAHRRLLASWTRARRSAELTSPAYGRLRHPIRTAIDESAAHVHASERQLAEAVAAEVRQEGLASGEPRAADDARRAFWLTTVARDALARIAQRADGPAGAAR